MSVETLNSVQWKRITEGQVLFLDTQIVRSPSGGWNGAIRHIVGPVELVDVWWLAHRDGAFDWIIPAENGSVTHIKNCLFTYVAYSVKAHDIRVIEGVQFLAADCTIIEPPTIGTRLKTLWRAFWRRS